jgi:hypothetical protein
MAGFLAYALAGAATGAGEGMIAEARAKREAAMEELRNSRLMEREERDRSFRSEEAEKSRGFTAGENQKNRDAQGNLITLEDGSSGILSGSTVRPMMDQDGKQRNVLQRSSDSAPAEVRTAEWLIQNGVAKDPDDAWRKVRSARDNPNSRAALVTSVYKTMLGDSLDRRSDSEKQASARSFVEDLLSEEESGPPPARPSQPQSGGAAPASSTPAPRADPGSPGARAGSAIGAAAQGGSQYTRDNPAKLDPQNPKATYDALPSGAHFVDPDGKIRVKP